MIPRNRAIIATILFAATIIGIAAGIRLAQIEAQEMLLQEVQNKTSEQDISDTDASAMKPDDSFFEEDDSVQAAKSDNVPAVAKPVKHALPPDPDGVSAEAYLVGNTKTGAIIFEKNVDKVLPFASMSKLITALVSTNTYMASDTIAITREETMVPPDASGLKAGETFTVEELLYPLLLNSSNVAAEALASSTNRVAFLKVMSDYSWEVGMPESNIADPTGLSATNSGTARGFFGLARYLFRERKDILDITKIASSSVAMTTEHEAHIFSSIHPFVHDSRFLGGKTGHTDAARDTMLTILEIDGKPIAFVVLRSMNRTKDTNLLIAKFLKSHP